MTDLGAARGALSGALWNGSFRKVGLVAPVLVCLIGQAHAGPWEVFENRCLGPMEHFMPGVTDGLEPLSADTAPSSIGALLEDRTIAFHAGSPGVFLHVSPGPACRVSVENLGEDTVLQARAWEADAEASGRYVRIEDDRLHSNQWREPRLVVHLFIDEARRLALFTAEETDLES